MKKYLFGILMLLISMNGFSQEKVKGKKEITVHTSVQCGDCKDRIESVLNYTKGVKYTEVDVASKNVVIGYKAKKITADEIKEIIRNIGYSADELPADQTALDKLPACCKPGGMD